MRALLIDHAGAAPRLAPLDPDALPEGDVVVAVSHSTLNYKDALLLCGRAPIARRFPMVPGIDLVGEVLDSRHPGFRPGDRVLANGFGLGEARWGGLAERARLPGDWLLPVPAPFTLRDAAAIGTAGYTAALAMDALADHGLRPGAPDTPAGRAIVTGAGGGVGGVAIALLAAAGWHVLAATGRADAAPYLHGLGAAEILPRAELAADPARPLSSERWAAAIDSVGGPMLAGLLAATARNGLVAACGLAGSAALPASVMPFILRGVTLRGIDSVQRPMPDRQRAWNRLAADLPPTTLERLAPHTVGLADAADAAAALLNGEIRGRVVVELAR